MGELQALQGQSGQASAATLGNPQPSLTAKKTLLIGFDFDCTLTVKHFYKIFAWGYTQGNPQIHPHCGAFFRWCEEQGLKFQPIQQHDQYDAMNCALDHFCRLYGV